MPEYAPLSDRYSHGRSVSEQLVHRGMRQKYGGENVVFRPCPYSMRLFFLASSFSMVVVAIVIQFIRPLSMLNCPLFNSIVPPFGPPNTGRFLSQLQRLSCLNTVSASSHCKPRRPFQRSPGFENSQHVGYSCTRRY